MKVHFFVRTLDEVNGGGSHYNSIEYIRALREGGHTVQVHVFYDVSNNFPSDITPIVHKGLGLGLRRERRYLANLLKEYESEADIFFLYSVEFAWGGGLYRRTGRTPVVVYMDAYLASMKCAHQESWSMKWYQYKRLPWDKTIGLSDARHVDQFLPCSPAIGDIYKGFGFPKDRFTVLPNIVPDPLGGDWEMGSAEKKSEEVNIIYLGRLIYDKGIDLLIDGLKALPEFPWKLSIVGDGGMRAGVEKRIREEKLNIKMYGWVPQREVGRFYSEADIFVHPARWPDPAPRAIVDALYSGLPVVVPDTGGSAWIAGDAGLVFKTGDLRSLTEALRSLLKNKHSVREELASKAKRQAMRFERSAVYPQLEGILRSVIEKSHQ